MSDVYVPEDVIRRLLFGLDDQMVDRLKMQPVHLWPEHYRAQAGRGWEHERRREGMIVDNMNMAADGRVNKPDNIFVQETLNEVKGLRREVGNLNQSILELKRVNELLRFRLNEKQTLLDQACDRNDQFKIRIAELETQHNSKPNVIRRF